MPLMLPAIELHIALSNRPIHHSAIPLSTTTDANRQLRRKLNTVPNKPQQFKQPIVLASNHRHSNLENSKAADRLPEAAACIADVAQKLTKQKNTQPEHLTQITTYFCSPWVRTARRLKITTYFCLSFKAGIGS